MTRSTKTKFSVRKGSDSSSYRRVPTVPSTSGGSRSPSPTGSTSGFTTQIPLPSSDSDSDIDERNDLEKKLFELVNSGDAEEVRQFLQKNNATNINKQDTEGISVLRLAVANNDADMIDVLIDDHFTIDMEDSLLHAIKLNYMPIVEQLLNWKDKVKTGKRVLETIFSKKLKENLFDTSEFGENITPLLMAAISGHYEIIELLYNRGERLGELHMPTCDCSLCGKSSSDLKKSNNRIQLLKGLANPTYIAFIAGVDKGFDPIERVFKLVEDIQTCMDEDHDYDDEYREILDNIKLFPTDMLAQCKNEDERKTFLKNKNGYEGNSSLPFPRLLLAMDLDQKEFVAHAHSQEVLYQEWIGEPWITQTFGESCLKKLFITLTVIFFPIISILMWFTLCCCKNIKIVRFMTSPVNRCRAYVVSYVVFMVVLYAMNSEGKPQGLIGPPSYFLPWIVSIYAISHFVSFIRHFLLHPKYFRSQGWNCFELLSHIFFIFTIVTWILLWLDQRHGIATVHTIKRQWLDPYHMVNISEVATAFASIFAGLRFLKIFILHPILGPMQIAFGKMTKDICLFALFFLVLLVSFSLGIQHLYRPYVSLSDKQSKSLSGFVAAFDTLFWCLFTMTEAASPGIAEFTFGNTTNHHFLTESVGKLTFIVFHILTVTCLMNMLTGMMSNTYGDILENMNVEWKYARSKMWTYFIEDTVVTAPFNIIPNGFFLCNIFAWLRAFATGGKSGKRAGCCYIAEVESEQDRKDREKEYAILIRRLLQRYFRRKSSIASDNNPAKEDITNVHNHVAELKKMTTLTLGQTNSKTLSTVLSPTHIATNASVSGNPGSGSAINTTTLSIHQSRIPTTNAFSVQSNFPSGMGQNSTSSPSPSKRVNFP